MTTAPSYVCQISVMSTHGQWDSPMPISEQISALERGHAPDLCTTDDTMNSGENCGGMHMEFRVVECSVLYGIKVLPEIS